MRVGEWRIGRGYGIVEEARGMIGQRRGGGERERGSVCDRVWVGEGRRVERRGAELRRGMRCKCRREEGW